MNKIKLIIKLIILFTILGVGAILVEFALDEEFWNSIPDTEEVDYFDHYERL